MKSRLLILIVFLPGILFATTYNSTLLSTKDYKEILSLMNQYIANSQKNASDNGEDSEASISALKEGLKVLLMRPDTDSIKSSLILILQKEIIKYQSFMSVLQDVVEKALSEFNSKKGSVAYQASLLYLIENSVSYLQAINNKESTAILKKIKTANLKIPKKILNYLLLEMGRGKTASPSYLANRILKKRMKEQKKAEKKRMKEQKKERKKEQNRKSKTKKKKIKIEKQNLSL